MSPADIQISIIIGLGTGLVSGVITGLITGFITSRVINKAEDKKRRRDIFHSGIYSYYEYLRSIKNELNRIINPQKDERFVELKKTLENYHPLFGNVKVDEFMTSDFEEILGNIGECLGSLENEITESTPNLHKLRNDISKFSYELLKMNTK